MFDVVAQFYMEPNKGKGLEASGRGGTKPTPSVCGAAAVAFTFRRVVAPLVASRSAVSENVCFLSLLEVSNFKVDGLGLICVDCDV